MTDRDGISRVVARERLADARRAVGEGRSPAIEKQRERRRLARAKTFGEFAVQWLKDVVVMWMRARDNQVNDLPILDQIVQQELSLEHQAIAIAILSEIDNEGRLGLVVYGKRCLAFLLKGEYVVIGRDRGRRP